MRLDPVKGLLTDRRALLGVLLATMLVMFTSNLGAYDLWWHLKAGELIVQTGRVPRCDPFSFTAAGRPWTYHSWLAGVVLYLVHAAGGAAGLVALKAALTSLALGLAWVAARAAGSGSGPCLGAGPGSRPPDARARHRSPPPVLVRAVRLLLPGARCGVRARAVQAGSAGGKALPARRGQRAACAPAAHGPVGKSPRGVPRGVARAGGLHGGPDGRGPGGRARQAPRAPAVQGRRGRQVPGARTYRRAVSRRRPAHPVRGGDAALPAAALRPGQARAGRGGMETPAPGGRLRRVLGAAGDGGRGTCHVGACLRAHRQAARARGRPVHGRGTHRRVRGDGRELRQEPCLVRPGGAAGSRASPRPCPVAAGRRARRQAQGGAVRDGLLRGLRGPGGGPSARRPFRLDGSAGAAPRACLRVPRCRSPARATLQRVRVGRLRHLAVVAAAQGLHRRPVPALR